jgi:hypothetical protein
LENTTTIEVSIRNANKIHSIATQLEKILHKRHVTPNQVLSVLLEIKPLDIVLQDMMLEDGIDHVK